MDSETRFQLFSFALLLIAFLAIWIYSQNIRKHRIYILSVKHHYEKAIKIGDKSLALQLGRKYYSLLRGGTLTMYDEQAITNDLSTIVNKGQQDQNP